MAGAHVPGVAATVGPTVVSRVVVIGTLAASLTNFRGALLRRLAAEGHAVSALAGDDDHVVRQQLALDNVAFETYPVERSGLNPIYDLRTLLALRQALRRLEPDVVLAYTVKPVVWTGLAMRSVPTARYYALVTGLGYALQRGSTARTVLGVGVEALYRAALRRASCVIFQNSDNQSVFLTRGLVQRTRTAVIDGSGVDLSHYAPAPLPEGAPVCLAIGRLLGEKGYREFTEAAAIVRRERPEVRFLLVGPVDTSPDGIPLAEVERWQQSGALEYLGAAKDVRPHLHGCHLFVHPSYHEGMPRTVLEAMAVGRPIVTTSAPGCRETVVDGVNGRLVPPGDARALAEALMDLLARRQDWQRMAAASRELVERRFDVNTINTRMLSLMELRRHA